MIVIGQLAKIILSSRLTPEGVTPVSEGTRVATHTYLTLDDQTNLSGLDPNIWIFVH